MTFSDKERTIILHSIEDTLRDLRFEISIHCEDGTLSKLGHFLAENILCNIELVLTLTYDQERTPQLNLPEKPEKRDQTLI